MAAVMQRDVVDIRRHQPRPPDGSRHAAEGAVAVLGRRGDVIGVARHAIADDLAIDLRPARLRMLQLLEHDHAGALAHDEAVAILVIGARGPLRLIVEGRAQRPAGAEAGDGQPRDRRFGAARHHHVGIAQRDQPRGVADRMRAGRAGGHDRVVRPLQAMADRDMAGSQVDDVAGDEEGADAARAALFQKHRILGDAVDAADAGTDHHAGGATILLALRLPAGIGQRHVGGGDPVGNEVGDLALFLRLQERVGIECSLAFARDARSDLAGKILGLEAADPRHRGTTGQQLPPGMLGTEAERRQQADARDDDTSHRKLSRSRRRSGRRRHLQSIRRSPCRYT